MLLIGERINTSRAAVDAMVAKRDADALAGLAKTQVEADADMLDVNVGTRLESEPKDMEWVVKTIQAAVQVPLCIDSPNPKALEAGLKAHQGKVMVNSITLERQRVEGILPIIKEYKPAVVALTMNNRGIPQDALGRLVVAQKLVETLAGAGVPADEVYIDPLVQPLGMNTENGLIVLEAVKLVKKELSGVHTICGLSNISFGLPQRGLLNRNFLVMLMAVGLDAAILDVLDKQMMADIYAAQALLNKDPYCLKYISACRAGRLGG